MSSPTTSPTALITDNLSTLLDPVSTSSHYLKQSLILSNPTTCMPSNPTTNPAIEPLPHLDYHLLYHLIALARPHLPARDLKRFDYLVDSRKGYYEAHHKFQFAYRTLLDLSTYADYLDKKFEELSAALDGEREGKAGLGLLNGLRETEIQKRKVVGGLEEALKEVEERGRKRRVASLWFSRAKWDFLVREMPVLREVGRQAFVHAKDKGVREGEGIGGDVAMLGMLSPPADTVTEFYSTTTTDPATNDDFTSTVQEEEPQSDVEMSHLALSSSERDAA